jgi:hypothetical protein
MTHIIDNFNIYLLTITSVVYEEPRAAELLQSIANSPSTLYFHYAMTNIHNSRLAEPILTQIEQPSMQMKADIMSYIYMPNVTPTWHY